MRTLKWWLIRHAPLTHAYRFYLKIHETSKEFEESIWKARVAGNIELVERLEWEGRTEVQQIETEQRIYHHRLLMRRAGRLLVGPPPYYDGENKRSIYYQELMHRGRYYLSDEGVKWIRTAIRDEEKQLHERRTRKLAWFTAIAAFVAAFAGGLAIWEKVEARFGNAPATPAPR